MIQYYSAKHKHMYVPQISLVRETIKVETISKLLEYVTKGHMAMETILF